MPLLLGRVRGRSRRQGAVSRAKEWAELQARRNGRYGKNRTRSHMNGNGDYGNGERYFFT